MSPQPWPAGVGRVILDEIDSTNEEARRRAEAGAEGPLWIMARRQTRGRGRQGRRWHDPGGNLAATCLLRPALPPAQVALMSFAACLAVADSFAALAPGVPVALKWPNDALLGGRKAAGVLLEGSGTGAGMAWLAVGIGVNLVSAPPPEPGAWPPTSLAAEGGSAPDPETALTHLAAAFAHWAGRLEAEGFAPLRAAWLARAARLGEKMVARLPGESVEGIFTDLDADGALVLSQAGRLRAIRAADVYFG